jgi:hypothetical protein
MSEITIILKSDEMTMKEKFLSYDKYTMSLDDPYILDLINQVKAKAKFSPHEITVKVSMVFLDDQS